MSLHGESRRTFQDLHRPQWICLRNPGKASRSWNCSGNPKPGDTGEKRKGAENILQYFFVFYYLCLHATHNLDLEPMEAP